MSTTDSHKEDFKSYLFNNLRFVCTLLFDTVPQTLGLVFLNLAGETTMIPILGFLISSFYFFFCLCFNHSDLINLKTGIYASKGNYLEFTRRLVQCILINLIFYIICLVLSVFSKSIFETLGISGNFLNQISFYMPIYGLSIGTLFMLVNMLRGMNISLMWKWW
jgi:hypothetical protein